MSVNVPIRTITPANVSGSAIAPPIANLPAPTKSDWGKSDLSAPDAGRVESGRMLKKRRGKADKLDIEWQYLSRVEAAMVLQAFDSEYALIEYLNARLGQWVTRHFYTGDMAATGWIPADDCWRSITLSAIQATPDPA